MSDTIERVLFNPYNGKLAIGIRLRFMDKYPSESMGAFEGKYELRIDPVELDAWAIDNEDGIWIVIPNDKYTKMIEDLGPL